jgi:hypothetical protein
MMAAELSVDRPAPDRPLVATLEDYADAFITGEDVAVSGLCGRILRGTRRDDFDVLTADSNPRIVRLVGPDILEQLPGQNGFEMLMTTGHTPQDIRDAVGRGNQFKLAVFPEGKIARPATWTNLLALAGEVYPDTSYGLLTNRRALQSASFTDIRAAAGYDLAAVAARGPDDGRFMTYDRYLTSGMGLIATRAFLCHTLHVDETFSGDGYAYTPDGERATQEYIIRNEPLDRLGEYASLNVPEVQLS